MASSARSVGRVHSVGPLRVSHQRHHFRVRHLQALRRGFIFISLKWWGSICLTLSLLWYCAGERFLEFPLWTAPQTHKVIPGCPGLSSSSINLPWWREGVPAFLEGWGHKAPQGAANLHCVLLQKFRHHLVNIRCMPHAGVVALTLYPDAHCIPTLDLLEYLSEDQESLYFDIYTRKDWGCMVAGRTLSGTLFRGKRHGWGLCTWTKGWLLGLKQF